MSVISFRVVSIDLKDSTLHNINQNNLVRLNVTQRPNHDTEEYLLKNASCLNNINHEFVIQDPTNKVERLTLTVRSVLKKTSVASIFNLEDDKPKMRKPKDRSVDHYIQGCKENREGYVECEYVEPKHSLIGYCTVNVKELEMGVNNTLRIELLTRGVVQVAGFVNLEVYTWNNPSRISQQKVSQTNNEPIMFVDPGCPTTNSQAFVF
ncbi:hypothetical protein M9Y10_002408 [Tritrichomonas musculus]|uniref:C2 NT-type domain-containing protein n=1 Tax=Tritrichomonas musculus TaxID=1915356 RepID=A0ABR2L9Q4_9EUKA